MSYVLYYFFSHHLVVTRYLNRTYKLCDAPNETMLNYSKEGATEDHGKIQ